MSLLNKIKSWIGLNKKEPVKEQVQEDFIEDELECTLLIGLKNGELVLYIASEDGNESTLGVMIAALLTGQLSKQLAEGAVEQLGVEKASIMLEASKVYAEEILKVQNNQVNNKPQEVPVILPSKAFQNDSQTPPL